MRIAMIDNYDSFTYNLVQYLSELGAAVDVVRNDAVSAAQLLDGRPAGVVISPGPGDPDTAGISLDAVRACAERGDAAARRVPGTPVDRRARSAARSCARGGSCTARFR
jgi:anthranilate/para-aminobenzoate synthase component II